MIRCCLCRQRYYYGQPQVERTSLPGSRWRCTDRTACRERVAAIVEAHKGLREACL